MFLVVPKVILINRGFSCPRQARLAGGLLTSCPLVRPFVRPSVRLSVRLYQTCEH